MYIRPKASALPQQRRRWTPITRRAWKAMSAEEQAKYESKPAKPPSEKQKRTLRKSQVAYRLRSVENAIARLQVALGDVKLTDWDDVVASKLDDLKVAVTCAKTQIDVAVWHAEALKLFKPKTDILD